jgi:exonuclease III
LWSSTSELGSGVCVILNETCKSSNQPVINSDGRMIQFCFHYLNFSPLHAIALYAPAKSSQRTQWFAEYLFKTTKQVDLLLGDFNFIEDKNDTNASNPHIDRRLVSIFKQFLSEHSLVDILPHRVTQFTFSHSTGTEFRLDRTYARTDLLSLVSNEEDFGDCNLPQSRMLM